MTKHQSPENMNEKRTDTPSLAQYFDVEEVGERWYLTCKVCGASWSLRKSIGGRGELVLLKHAYSHRRPDRSAGRQHSGAED